MHKTREERFWKYVQKTQTCWFWTAYKTPLGYGRFQWATGKQVFAHRAALQIAGVDVPADKVVCHKCDTSSCVRPDHLTVGTVAENNADMHRKGRNAKGPAARGNYKLTEEDVLEMRLMRSTGILLRELAERFKTTKSNVHAIIARETWKDV